MMRALLLVPLLLAGCGDGGDAKAAFVAKAEKVCATAKADKAKNPMPSTVSALPAYADTLVGIAERAHRELSALSLPEADEADLRTKLLDPLGADVSAGKAFAAKLRAAGGDSATLVPLLSQRPKSTVDLAYARSYGLTTCAEAAS